MRKRNLTCLVCLIGFILMPPFLSRAQQQRGQGVRPTSTSGNAEQRVALIIGNANYQEGKQLPNPRNDAQDMAQTLRSLGFDVILGEDLTLEAMEERARTFGERLRKGGVGLFYYAGHGLQIEGKNYLIPVNADIRSRTDVKFKALEVGYVLGQMEEAKNALNIVILDACRDNPFRSFVRSTQGGLAGISGFPGQVYIAYATAADSTASDGSGRNGLFTGELLAQMKVPGQDLQKVFRNVRANVLQKSGGQQMPFGYDSIVDDFYFSPANEMTRETAMPTTHSPSRKPPPAANEIPPASPQEKNAERHLLKCRQRYKESKEFSSIQSATEALREAISECEKAKKLGSSDPLITEVSEDPRAKNLN